jgi:hypothetical protein
VSNRNIESAAFHHELDDDRRAAHECQLAALQADADYAEHCERQRQQDLAAQMELDAMTRDASGQVIRPVRQAVARFDRSKWTSEQWAVITAKGA